MRLLLSTDTAPDDADALLRDFAALPVRIAPGRAARFVVRFVYPAQLADGMQMVLAQADVDHQLEPFATAHDVGVSPAVDYQQRRVDLSLTNASTLRSSVRAGRLMAVRVRLTNTGNTVAIGAMRFDMHASTDSALSDDDRSLLSRPARIFLPAGASRVIVLVFRVPTDLTAGNYSLIATITPDAALGDTNVADKSAVSAFAIS